MITEKDLQEAIAECKGKRNPDANTCIKLAAFLTIQREMFGEHETQASQPVYSYSSAPVESVVYDSGTEFSQKVYGMNIDDMMGIMDELMTTLQIVNPRLYAGVMRKITESP